MTASILLVDDDRTLLSALRRTLVDHFEITTASSGAEALGLFRSGQSFDCVVSDMKMPHMDGLQLVTEITRNWPHIPCIILTGNQDEETLQRIAIHGSVVQLLNKPTLGEELVAAIKQAIVPVQTTSA